MGENILTGIIEKTLAGSRMENDELIFLLENDVSPDALSSAASMINMEKNRGRVTYVVNRNINFTNICSLDCRFCGYRRTKRSRDAFLLDYEQVIEKIAEGRSKIGIDEICVTGGINPELAPDYYFGLIKSVRDSFPGLHIHAFSPQEVFELSGATGKSYKETMLKLVDCGLDSMPGTAAEILAPETRKVICPKKIDTATWVDIIESAHGAGIKTSATILFGHLESAGDIALHLEIIRNIQDKTGGFTEFIPLPFISSKTPLRNRVGGLFSGDINKIFKFYAILRLYLDNFKNIQVSWPKIGVDNALKSFAFGINDFGGTLMEENITKSAGGGYGEFLSEEEIVSLINSAGKIPVRRDTLYNCYGSVINHDNGTGIAGYGKTADGSGIR